jgi:hypothetical protein
MESLRRDVCKYFLSNFLMVAYSNLLFKVYFISFSSCARYVVPHNEGDPKQPYNLQRERTTEAATWFHYCVFGRRADVISGAGMQLTLCLLPTSMNSYQLYDLRDV